MFNAENGSWYKINCVKVTINAQFIWKQQLSSFLEMFLFAYTKISMIKIIH